MTGGREMETRQKLKNYEIHELEGGGEKKSLKGCFGTKDPPPSPREQFLTLQPR